MGQDEQREFERYQDWQREKEEHGEQQYHIYLEDRIKELETEAKKQLDRGILVDRIKELEVDNKNLVQMLKDSLNCKIYQAEEQLEKVRGEAKCLWNWAHNWDSPFIKDDHWQVTDGPRIKQALIKEDK